MLKRSDMDVCNDWSSSAASVKQKILLMLSRSDSMHPLQPSDVDLWVLLSVMRHWHRVLGITIFTLLLSLHACFNWL